MQLFLGIDGGGTRCRAAVSDASGCVLGTGSAGPANIATDIENARVNILDATMQALQGVVGPSAADVLPHLHAALGLAGANVPTCAARLSTTLPFASIQIKSDAVIAAKGALHNDDGIVAALGTGSVFAVQRAGKLSQNGGWGFVLGDEGGGAWLGRALLSRSLRAVDGVEPMTPLLQSTLNDLGASSGVLSFGLTGRPADFAAFAPQIAASNDVAARAIMLQAETDITAMIDHLQGSAPVPVTFIGGLGQIFAARLADRWPQRIAYGSGLDGALWFARRGIPA
ncbi:MAG: BadF/BadG/BcrA/BcrD ATPase family protein [Paracoccaceae bacterium]